MYSIARVTASDELQVMHGDQVLWRMARTTLQAIWSELSYRMQALRDDPACARSAYTYLTQTEKNALSTHVTFDWLESAQQTPYLARRPKVAILREQGVNGHLEMAAAFDAAGFDAVDVHMSDLLSGRVTWMILLDWPRVVDFLMVMCWVQGVDGRNPY